MTWPILVDSSTDDMLKAMKKTILLLSFVLLSNLAFANPPSGTYEGTIGNLPISVLFADPDGDYYYHKIGKTIELNAIPDKPGMYQESEPSHPRFAEDFDPADDNYWEITADKDGALSGTWKSGDKTLKIALHKVADNTFEAKRLDRPFG